MTSTDARPSRREERRLDQAAAAQIARDDLAARAKLRAADLRAAQDRRLTARRARAARWSKTAAWCAGNTAELLLAPVIAVSIALSWSSVAAFGVWLFGPAGHAFPVVPDGGMWACAVIAALHRRRHPGEPAWRWQAGVAFFAAVTASTNFLHGLTERGAAAGVAMALVSVSGLAAHQLVTSAPAQTRAERDEARLNRALRRRLMSARLTAARAAAFRFDGAGGALPVYDSGLRTVARGLIRPRLKPVAVSPAEAHETAPAGLKIEPVPAPAETAPPEPPAALSAPPAEGSAEPPNSQAGSGSQALAEAPADPSPVSLPAAAVAAPPEARAEPARPRPSSRRQPKSGTRKTRSGTAPDTITALIKSGVSNSEIVSRTGKSLATVKRRRSTFVAAGGNVLPMARKQA